MLKKIILTTFTFVIVGAFVFIAAWLVDNQSVALPQTISANTPCPVAGCTQPDGVCHVAAAAPKPDGNLTMQCPRIKSCNDTQCHAWDRISSSRSKPDDMSLNLWILVPVILTLALVGLVRKL